MTHTSTYKTTCTDHSGGPASPHTVECFMVIPFLELRCLHQWLPWLRLPNGSDWTECVECGEGYQYDH